MASNDQAKLEAEKLLSATRKKAPLKSSETTAQKAAQASQLFDEIGKIQSTTQARPQAPAQAPQATEQQPTSDDGEVLSTELAERVIKLEMQQNAARDQIQKLLEAKKKLENASRKAREQADKHQQETNAKLQKQLNSLIKEKEKEYLRIKNEIKDIKDHAEQEAALLKAQRDAARIMAQEHNEAAEAGMTQGSGKVKQIAVIAGSVTVALLVISLLLLLFVDKIPFLHRIIAPQAHPQVTATATDTATAIPGSAEAAAEAEEKPEKKPAVQVPTEPIRPMRAYRDRLKSGGFGPAMITIPGGEYLLGAMPTQPYPEELPQTKVTLRNFSISKYEITQEEYAHFVKSTGREMPYLKKPHKNPKYPIINVSWENAVDYTQWLSSQTGHQYRLPSEREWEYAASAGMKTTYPWGDKLGENNANCASCGSRWDGKQIAPVGSFSPNPVSLHDMIGNVQEWTIECHRFNYAGTPTSGHVWEGGNCSRYMVRGGSFRTYENALRLTKRKSLSSRARGDDLGFRVVRVH